MLSLAAAMAAAALVPSPAQVEAISQAVEGGQIVRLSFSEMASVTSAPLPGPVRGDISTASLRLEGSAYAFETGVRNIAINNGIGSNSQAATSISIQVGLPQVGN